MTKNMALGTVVVAIKITCNTTVPTSLTRFVCKLTNCAACSQRCKMPVRTACNVSFIFFKNRRLKKGDGLSALLRRVLDIDNCRRDARIEFVPLSHALKADSLLTKLSCDARRGSKIQYLLKGSFCLLNHTLCTKYIGFYAGDLLVAARRLATYVCLLAFDRGLELIENALYKISKLCTFHHDKGICVQINFFEIAINKPSVN
jgi:hypothetical protein